MNKFNIKINAYMKRMMRWSPSQIKAFLEKHNNFSSKVYSSLLEVAGHIHLRDISANRINSI